MRKNHKIYVSRTHLIVTFLVIIAPFLFLLTFSKLAHIETSKLFYDVGISIVRIFTAYLIAVTLGWLLAIIFYKGPLSAVALPAFDVMQSFPTFATLPLAVTFFGASNATVIAFLVITMIWPILFSVLGSMRQVKREWEEAIIVSQLRGWNYFRRFLLPVSIPALITGSIIGLGEGWEAVIATEIIVGSKQGLGSFFQAFSTNPTMTFLGILGLLLIIFSVSKLIWLPLLNKSHKMMDE